MISVVPDLMSGSWSLLTVWRTGWWRWVCLWERPKEAQEAGCFPPRASSVTTRRPSRSRTSAPRHPWTVTTWSRWTPTQRRATTTSAAPQSCPGWGCTAAGTPMGAMAEGEWARSEATPTLGGWHLPTNGKTPLNSCTSSLEEEEGRDCGLGVRMRWRCERMMKRLLKA